MAEFTDLIQHLSTRNSLTIYNMLQAISQNEYGDLEYVNEFDESVWIPPGGDTTGLIPVYLTDRFVIVPEVFEDTRYTGGASILVRPCLRLTGIANTLTIAPGLIGETLLNIPIKIQEGMSLEVNDVYMLQFKYNDSDSDLFLEPVDLHGLLTLHDKVAALENLNFSLHEDTLDATKNYVSVGNSLVTNKDVTVGDAAVVKLSSSIHLPKDAKVYVRDEAGEYQNEGSPMTQVKTESIAAIAVAEELDRRIIMSSLTPAQYEAVNSALPNGTLYFQLREVLS